MLEPIRKATRRAATLLAWLSSATLVLIMTITFVDVIGRSVFNRSLLGTVESIELLMGGLVFSGLAITEIHRGHVVVETFQNLFPRPLHRASVFVNAVLAVGVTWVLTQQLFNKTISIWEEGEFTQILHVPYWPTAFLMLAGIALFLLVLVLQLIEGLLGKGD